jgi:hypothetical protein
MTDIITTDDEYTTITLTDEEFVASCVSKEAIKLLEVYIEPDGENKTVFWTSEPAVLCNAYMALRDNFSSMTDVAKLIASELIERQKQPQLEEILKERQKQNDE